MTGTLDKKEYERQYRINNRDKIIEYLKQWRTNNPEYTKQRYENNRGKLLKENKEWRESHREYRKEYRKQYNKDHKEGISEYSKQYKKGHREEFIKYYRYKRKTDLRYNLGNKMSRAIRSSLKNGKNGYHWEDIVGYTSNDLIKRLIKIIPNGYDWNNFLQGKLHIDHIIPISAFNFTKPEHIDFKRCWALENLRLLPAEENFKKSNKLFRPFQPALAI